MEHDTSTLSRFRKTLETWKGHLFTETLNHLDRQLSYLLEEEEDLAELSHAPDPKSFEALLSYLAARPWIKAPSLTLTETGLSSPIGDRQTTLRLDCQSIFSTKDVSAGRLSTRAIRRHRRWLAEPAPPRTLISSFGLTEAGSAFEGRSCS